MHEGQREGIREEEEGRVIQGKERGGQFQLTTPTKN
jgi:hypothetical protein